MKDLLAKLRPTVLCIGAMLTLVCVVDILAEGDATVGLAAAGRAGGDSPGCRGARLG